MKSNKMRLFSILVSGLAAWGSSPLWAANSWWSNNAGGDFTNAANWTAGVPGAGNDANFTNNAGYQVDWTTSITNANAFFNGGVVTQNIGSSIWNLSTAYKLGQNAGQTGTVVMTSGSLIANAGAFDFVIGDSGVGSFTQNGGSVLVSEVRIGNGNGGSAVTLSGGSTVWSNTGTMYLGVSTVGQNTFTVTNGAHAYSMGAFPYTVVGYQGNSNVAIVTGTGSVWSNANALYLAYAAGSSNQLQILDGGLVVDTSGFVGGAAGSSGNKVLVSGPGSIWRNTVDYRIGDNTGSGNQLLVTNQGTVISLGNVYVGNQGSNGSVIVTGAGSVLTNTGAFYVGYSGTARGNQLQVLANATMYAGSLDIGGNTSGGAADSNSVVISGGGAIRVAAAGDARVGSGGGSYNSLLITNSGLLVDSTGRFGDGGGTNGAIVTDSGSVWSNTSVVHMGVSGSGGNRLVVTNGGLMYVGASGFNLGYATANNIVTVTDNGVLTNTAAVNLGYLDGGVGNQLNVARTGLVYASTLALGNAFSGLNASNNSVTVSTGGRLTDGTAYLGYSGSSNTITVTDPGSVLSNTAFLYLGLAGASARNSLLITNGGVVYTGSSGSWVGYQGSSNTVTVTGNGSIWTNTGSITVGGLYFYNLTNTGNRVSIVNSGLVVSAGVIIGDAGSGTGESDFNTMTVSDTGSVLRSSAITAMTVGGVGYGNQLIISNGATVYTLGSTTGFQIGQAAKATNNSIVVTGNGTIWTNTGSGYVGNGGGFNQLTIRDGAVAYASMNIGGNGSNTSGSNNTVIVSGATLFGNVQLGASSANNRLIITNGGKVLYAGANIAVGSPASSSGNSVLIAGAGSVWSNGTFFLGASGAGNSLVVSNGGALYTADTYLGRNLGSDNNSAIVTGPGSIWVAGSFAVGSNGANKGISTTLRVENGGTLETGAGGYVAGLNGSGTVSNNGGVYQFTHAAPSIIPGTAGAISISNGWVSFRGITDADVKSDWTGNLTNITYSGNNTFRLNSASNSTVNQSYTFNTGLGATNYVGLELVNGNSLWRSANLTIGSGGTFLASNTIGTVAALVTNIGNIEVNYSKMTWSSNLFISGRYKSDPSTNTYLADVTVSQSGTLAGSVGDLFDFKKSLYINSTNNIGFQLATSAVQFSGGGMHTNAITGADMGVNIAAYAAAFESQTNFAYGELHLGSVTDQICFTCGIQPPPAVTNIGLYVGWLDLLGNPNLVTNLHAASGINIYYNASDSRNAYLSDLSYQLTDCNFATGGGFLIPVVPEPSALAFLSLAALLAMRCKRR